MKIYDGLRKSANTSNLKICTVLNLFYFTMFCMKSVLCQSHEGHVVNLNLILIMFPGNLCRTSLRAVEGRRTSSKIRMFMISLLLYCTMALF